MAPLPDHDKTPDKNKEDKAKDKPKEPQKDEKTLSNLNDRELKALLDEAINYKNPKDREGKSELFNDLLLEAEETERIARATSAGGSELVRHCNPAARRQRHSGGPRGRRYGGPASSGLMGRSVSERGTHGGSLDNLAKEELYEATCRRLRGARKSSTSSSGASSSCGGNQVRVSARQREGGSLPCNVNSGETSRDFLEEAKRSREMKDKDYMVVDIEKERLIENDLLARGYEERLIDGGGPSRGGPSTPVETHIVTATPRYTSKATLHIQSNRASNVDDAIPLPDLDNSASDKKTIDANALAKVVQHSKYQVIIPTYPVKTAGVEEKKVDENGNALHQTKEKKKKKQSDKNVVVLKSENIEGHKSEIINNVDQLLHYIEGTTENNIKTRPVQSKSKQLHKQHASEDGGSKTSKKKHTKSGVKESGSNVALEGRHELKKSNSLSEISGMKLDREFEAFGSGKNKQEKEEENVVLRGNKPSVDRARERRSWGNVEPHSFQTLYNASSLENLETSTDNWEVTRPKKKSKKRRNSVSSASGARQNSSNSGVSSSVSNEDRRPRRAPSPDLGVVIVGVSNVKTTRSMPHSEKSNDSSSDVDSVHSLPMDGPISYADIAKNSEKKKPSPEKQERPAPASKEKSPQPTKQSETDSKTSTSHVVQPATNPLEKSPNLSSSVNPSLSSNNPVSSKTIVPDVHNIKSFPAITGSTTKTPSPSVVTSTAASPQTQNVTTTSDKAVQSTLSYEETFVREKTPTAVTQKSHAAAGVTLQSVPMETSQVVAATQTSPAVSAVLPAGGVASSVAPPSNGKKQPTPNNNVAKERRTKGGGSGKDVGLIQPNHTVQGFFGAQGDVHNELSLMRDPAQYATQRMPPDIMDVSTIEKIQFMNCSNAATSTPVIHSTTSHNSTQVSYVHTPPSAVVAAPSDVPTHQGGTKGKRKKGGNASNTPKNLGGGEVRSVSEEHVAVVASVCDTSLEERGAGNRMVNGISDETSFSSPEPPLPATGVVLSAPPPESPPPVVILSGLPKDVPSGLIFGFDINEQLLMEDSGGGGDAVQQQQLTNNTVVVSGQNVSENNITEISIERLPCRGEEWVKRYKPPANDRGPPKHNHDKIVSFISAAWENVLSQQIQYYSDSL